MLRQRLITLSLVAVCAHACRTPDAAEIAASKDGDDPAAHAGASHAAAPSIDFYEATRIRGLAAAKSCDTFQAAQGFTVTRRDGAGNAVEGKIRVLADNAGDKIVLLGDFNKWGAERTPADSLQAVEGTPYFEGTVRSLTHKMEYRLEVNGVQLLDPAATLFTTPKAEHLNSVFWDFGRPGAFKMTTSSVDLRDKPVIIAESEVFELAAKWPAGGRKGPPSQGETYKFIAQSGLIDELKKVGYNAIELLPFNTSMDGGHWHYRYQVYGQFAPEGRYGDPDDFARMVEAFNKGGIAVIMDAVVGHYPFKGNDGMHDIAPIGLHQWKKADGGALYGAFKSPWGTNRYDYANKFIRKFLDDGLTHMTCRYGLSGVRFDNLDGIRLYEGPGGGGPEFLKETMATLRDYRPEMILIGEMFFGHNEVTERLDNEGGFGVSVRTHSELFDFFKDNMIQKTEAVDMNRLRGAIRTPWDNREAARVTYATNHDEAANRRDGATGAYLGTLLNGGGWYYVEHKTMAFASLALLSGSVYLDMPQLRLLQEGNFNDNPAVDWDLRRLDSQRGVYTYFADLAGFVRGRSAFAFHNFGPAIENHVDTNAGRRIISLRREDKATGKVVLVVINLGHVGLTNYGVGIAGGGTYRVMIESDAKKYGGSGELEKRAPTGLVTAEGSALHGKDKSLSVPFLPPYGVVVLEKQ